MTLGRASYRCFTGIVAWGVVAECSPLVKGAIMFTDICFCRLFEKLLLSLRLTMMPCQSQSLLTSSKICKLVFTNDRADRCVIKLSDLVFRNEMFTQKHLPYFEVFVLRNWKRSWGLKRTSAAATPLALHKWLHFRIIDGVALLQPFKRLDVVCTHKFSVRRRRLCAP